MSDLRNDLDRALGHLPPPALSLPDVNRRRVQLRRRQQLSAAVLAMLVIVAAVGTFLASYLAARHQPANGGMITPSNAGSLGLAWSADLGADAPARHVEAGPLVYAPAFADGVVIVGSGGGVVEAFPSSCEAEQCRPLWSARTDGAVVRSPVVSGDQVFVSTASGKLYAFPVRCEDPCRPNWVGGLKGMIGSSPVVANGMVYGINIDQGRLFAFDEHCRPNAAGVCRHAWSRAFYAHRDPPFGPLSHEVEGEMTPVVAGDRVYAGDWGKVGVGMLHVFDARAGSPVWNSVWTDRGAPFYMDRPAVDGDRVFWSAGEDTVYAYRQSCTGEGWNGPANTAGHRCPPEWSIGKPSWPPGGSGDIFYDSVTAGAGTVFVTAGFNPGVAGRVFAFPEDCSVRDGRCPPLWSATFVGHPAWNYPVIADGVVYVAATGGGGDQGSLSAYASDCRSDGATCTPLWTAGAEGTHGLAFTPGTPVIRDGVIYAGTTWGDLVAYPTDCRGVCQPAWTWSAAGSGGAVSPPAVGDGTIFVLTERGQLLAFTPGGSAGSSGRIWDAWTIAFYASIAAIAAAVVLRRRSSRL